MPIGAAIYTASAYLLSHHARTRPRRRLQTEVPTLSAPVFFYAGAQSADFTALTVGDAGHWRKDPKQVVRRR